MVPDTVLTRDSIQMKSACNIYNAFVQRLPVHWTRDQCDSTECNRQEGEVTHPDIRAIRWFAGGI